MIDFKIFHPVRWIYKFNEYCGRECSLMIGRAYRRKWDFSFNENIRFWILSKLEWWSRKLCNRRWKYPLTDAEREAREAEWEKAYYEDHAQTYYDQCLDEDLSPRNKAFMDDLLDPAIDWEDQTGYCEEDEFWTPDPREDHYG